MKNAERKAGRPVKVARGCVASREQPDQTPICPCPESCLTVSDPGSISSFTCTTPPCHESISQLVPVQSPISSNSCQIRGSAEWPVEHYTALGTIRESPDGETLLPTEC